MAWLRLYDDTPDDPKLRTLPVEERWVWITLLCLAKRSPVQGKVLIARNVPATLQDVASVANVPLKSVESAIANFTAREMVQVEESGTISITNWRKRQYESDSSTERVRRYRQRQKAERDRNADETLQERYGSATVTPPDNREQIEPLDSQKNPSGSSSSRAKASSPPGADEIPSRGAAIGAWGDAFKETCARWGVEIPATASKTLYGVIGRLVQRYGPDEMQRALDDLDLEFAGGWKPENPVSVLASKLHGSRKREKVVFAQL